MIPRFSLSRPRTLGEAIEAFRSADGDAAYIAGGTELLQVMKMGFAQVGRLVDLKRIDELRGIRAGDSGGLRIGATTTHRELERSPDVLAAFPGLAELERGVANARVRSTGTLGGNIAFAEPHSDPATLLVACGASVDLRGESGTRSLPVSEFIVAPLTTARRPEEILVAIRVPGRRPREGRACAKLAFFERPAATVAVRLTVAGRAIGAATVAVGSVTDVPTIVPEAGASLVGTAADPGALAAAVSGAGGVFDGLDIASDLNGSPDYKRHLLGVLLGRAARSAFREALADA